MTAPRITAVIVARNAAFTLAAMLRHLQANAIPAVVVDHGSTDATWRIAEAHWGAPVLSLLKEPFTGTFSLTRQLALKRTIFQGLETDWLIHVDADELLLPPDGLRDLRQVVDQADAEGAIAVGGDEFVFLPRSEEEHHAPDRFQDSLRSYVAFQPENEKQRLFRADAPLQLWEQTGGHSVTRSPEALASVRLRIAHYFGASLDDIRSQYLPRVFDPVEVAAGWHTTRIGAAGDFVAAPDPGTLRDLDKDGWEAADPLSRLPVFRTVAPAQAPTGLDADMVLSGDPGPRLWALKRCLQTLYPDRRIAATRAVPPAHVPCIHVIEDGRYRAAEADRPARSAAAGWCRSIAMRRQVGLTRPGIVELRLEDLDPGGLALKAAAERAWAGEVALARFRRLPAPPGLCSTRRAGFEAVAGPLLRDLCYGVG